MGFPIPSDAYCSFCERLLVEIEGLVLCSPHADICEKCIVAGYNQYVEWKTKQEVLANVD